ncbi:MAG: hypothetical protein H7067_15345 [Burkholderiales bacterium]|nr:hypothetical protein [Opitutaceae bacterium]
MKVKYGSLWLASGGKEAAQDVRLNGRQVVDVQQLFNAAAVRPHGRGNKVDVFSFAIKLDKASRKLSERFLLSHFSDLPINGQLELVCGRAEDEGGEQSFFNQCAFETCERTYVGRSPAIRYTFVCGLFTENGETIISEEGDVIRGKVNLTAADVDKAVTFLASIGAPPTVVQCWIVPPDGGDFIDCRALMSSITDEGFTAVFAAAIPAAGYELHWLIVK